MKNNLFFILIIILSFFTILSIYFLKNDNNFSYAACGFFMTIIMLFQYKFALKKPKEFGAANPIKNHYHSIGKPQKYRKLCLIISVVFVLIGIFNFIGGLTK